MKRVAIIGGGIAGLSAAYYLEKAKQNGARLDWVLFEKSDRLGGVIETEERDGFVLEAGPDSFLTAKPDAARLCTELGLADQIIRSNDRDRKTYILVKGQLVPIPQGLEFMVPTRVWPMVTTPLFSFGTKLRMTRELFSARRNETGDESVGEFVRRHFGQEMVDRIAEPLLAGVYGGNADRMSVRAVLPRFAEMERESGSLVRATLKARKARSKSAAPPQPLFTSLKNGVQQMTDRAAAALPPERMRLRQAIPGLRSSGAGWIIDSPERNEPFDAVVLAVPAPAAAALLREVNSELVAGLQQIQYSSSAVVILGYDRPFSLLPGHGFLVPRTEGRKILACTFVHRKFPFRAPEGAALLRCFISSSRVPDLNAQSDERLRSTIQQELRELIGLSETPSFSEVYRWECALPQYPTGHLEKVAQMEKILAGLPGIHLIGNSFHGIGIPDCIRSGRLAAEKITSAALQPVSV